MCSSQGVNMDVNVFQVTDHICMLQDYVNGMSCLHVDEHEYGYLKLLILFSPGNNKFCLKYSTPILIPILQRMSYIAANSWFRLTKIPRFSNSNFSLYTLLMQN